MTLLALSMILIILFIYHPLFTPSQMKSPKSGEPRSILTASGGADKRCCLKTTTKHHRWKRKWNCCSSVPDSPDVTEDVMRTIAAAASSTAVVVATPHQPPNSMYESPAPMLEIPDEIYQQQLRKQQFIERYKRKQLQESLQQQQQFQSPAASPVENDFSTEFHIVQRYGLPPLRVPNPSAMGATGVPMMLSSPSASTAAHKPDVGSGSQRRRATRPWPISRFRQVLRMIGRYRRPGCRGLHRGAGQNNAHVIGEANDENAQSANNAAGSNVETATGKTSTTDDNDPDVRCIPLHGHRRQLAPLLAPPPLRRKIRTDIETLGTYLSGGAEASLDVTPRVSSSSAANTPSRFLRGSGNISGNNGGSMRRGRRKNCMRQLSPTLSPIHESGMSNPTSPLPFRRSGNKQQRGEAVIEVASVSATVAKAESIEQRFVM